MCYVRYNRRYKDDFKRFVFLSGLLFSGRGREVGSWSFYFEDRSFKRVLFLSVLSRVL